MPSQVPVVVHYIQLDSDNVCECYVTSAYSIQVENNNNNEVTFFVVTRNRYIAVYDMTGVYPQRSLVDSWSRGRQHGVIRYRVQYVAMLTRGAIWRAW